MCRTNRFILTTVSLAALTASPAFAQVGQTKSDQAPPQALTTEQAVKSGQPTPNCNVPAGVPLPPECRPATGGEAITITGTRLRTPNLESPLPVTSVGGQEFFQTGNVSVGDKLAELPQIASTFTQANSTRFLGTAGLNLLDLRGLGTARTLVLVNGRRHVGGDVLNTGVSVDVNTIPTDLIDRVDVVTGGNSAVYGSDAIAGVVNFVLKDHYSGVQLRGQGGESKYGDAGAYFVSALVGKNFADNRGNVALNVEYARRNQAWGNDRTWLRSRLVQVDSDPAGTPNGSDGNPDRILNPDFTSSTFSNTGTVRIGGTNFLGQPSGLTCGVDPHGNPYTCPFIFQPNGQLVPQTGTRVGLGPNGQFIGGNGEGFWSGQQIQVTPQLNRYNINLLGHIEASPGFVPFIEAKFSRTDSTGTGGNGPAFFSGSVLGDPMQFLVSNGNRERISLSNPYLNPDAATTIRNAILQSGINNCNFRPLTSTDIARLNAGTFRFCTQESMLGLGNRTEKARRDTIRLVLGLRGDLGSDWNYEVSLNYGTLNERTKVLGNLDVQRFLLAMDAVRDPTTGNIVCASQINPSRAIGYYPWLYYQYGYPTPPADPNANKRLANDIAQCTPINPLGGNFTDAQRAYLLENTTSTGRTKQYDATAFVSGDTGRFLNLPGGPIGIVLGAEYRSDNLYYHQAEDVQLGYTFYNSIPTFRAPASDVKEAFGEIRLPILKDLPFAHELEISGAARVSDYNLGKTGTVWAYNGNAIYAPVEGVRLRGNYARAVRAPNQVELFTPFGQNFSLVSDPCDVNQIGNNPNRPANCLAAGIPAGTHIQYSSSLGFLSGGNKELSAEKSDSITLGGVLTPKLLPGFSASVDYYNIKIKKAISAPSAQQIIDACYDQPSLNNQFCALFQRGDAGGNTGHNGQPFGIIDNSLHVQPLNFASLKARGIDTEIAYRHQVGRIGRFDTRLNWTHALELTVFQDPTQPNFGNRLLSELGNPQDAFNWNSSLQHGRFTLGYQLRYIGKMVVDQYEDWFSFEGRPPQDADYADRTWYPARWYHDVRLGVDVGSRFNIYAGVDNLTNQKPPYALSGIGGGSAIYDAIGRFYYGGVVAKFK